jgi:hypothetical protein
MIGFIDLRSVIHFCKRVLEGSEVLVMMLCKTFWLVEGVVMNLLYLIQVYLLTNIRISCCLLLLRCASKYQTIRA